MAQQVEDVAPTCSQKLTSSSLQKKIHINKIKTIIQHSCKKSIFWLTVTQAKPMNVLMRYMCQCFPFHFSSTREDEDDHSELRDERVHPADATVEEKGGLLGWDD